MTSAARSAFRAGGAAADAVGAAAAEAAGVAAAGVALAVAAGVGVGVWRAGAVACAARRLELALELVLSAVALLSPSAVAVSSASEMGTPQARRPAERTMQASPESLPAVLQAERPPRRDSIEQL